MPDPAGFGIDQLLESVYYLMAGDVGQGYGMVLEPVDSLDPCADMDPEERAEEQRSIELEICASRRLTSRIELNQWLAGLFDGRFWSDGWNAEGYSG